MAFEVFRLIGRITLDSAKAIEAKLKGVTSAAQKTSDTMDAAGKTAKELGDTTSRAAEKMGDSVQGAQNRVEEYRKEMRKAYEEQRKAQAPLRAQMEEIEKQWRDMGKAAQSYTGSNRAFMQQVQQLGEQQKKVADQLVASNNLAKASFLEGIGAMLAASTQSSKIAANFDRMGNPLYRINNGLLQVTGSVEKLARSGAPSVLALKLLGPTASMKELGDMTRLITQGQMRMQAVFLATALAAGVLTAALAKAAYGPDPAKVRADIAQVEAAYDEAFDKRQEEVYQWAGLFEKVEFKPPNPQSLLNALAGQVDIMKNWMNNLQTLMQRGVDEGLIAELQKMGPKAAGEIQALINMSGPELDKYVALWREKHALAAQQATSELEGLRQATDAQIKKLQASITPLAESWEKFKQTWGEALAPFIESFGEVAAKVVDAGTAIGEFLNKLNGINPAITTTIGWFTFLTIVFTMLLAPLAVGIGLTGGLAAAFTLLWTAMSPLLIGLATVLGIAALLAAAIIGIVAVIKNWGAIAAWFQGIWSVTLTWLTSAWNTTIAWLTAFLEGAKAWFSGLWQGFISILVGFGNYLLSFPAFRSFVNYVQETFSFLKQFFSILWSTIKALFQVAWNSILSIVMPIVNSITKTISSAFQSAKNAISSALSSAKSTASSIFSSIYSVIASIANQIWSSITGTFNRVKSAMTGPIDSAKSLIQSALSRIQSAFSSLKLSFPKPKLPHFSVKEAAKTIAGVRVPYPSVSVDWYAKGGVFDSASIIGIGEKTKEAAIPLEGRYMRPFAEAIASQMPADADRRAMQIEIPLYLNGREVARAVASDMDTALERTRRISNRGRGS